MAFKKKPRRPFKRKDDGLTDEERLQQEIRRIKMPQGKEMFGILEQRLGGSRNKVRCFDGRTRVCRIPGRLKRRLWCREGDLLLIEPWEFGGDEKGDVLFKYKKGQVDYLKKRGVLKALDDIDEF